MEEFYKGENVMKTIILKISKFAYFFTACFVLLSIHAHAYIDPSAVTYIIQAVAAAFIAVGALITVFRHKILAFFTKGKKETEKREIHIKEEITEDSVNE